MNKEHARLIAVRLSRELKILKPSFKHFFGLRQGNSVDCGLYVLLNADIAIAHFTKSNKAQDYQPCKEKNISAMRKEMLLLIQQVSNNQKQDILRIIN